MEHQPLLAAQRDDLDEILRRAAVLLAARLARIDVRAQADMRDQARASRGYLAHQLAEHALRKRVRLELVVLDHRAKPRLVADVAADRPPVHAGQRELAEATVGEVAGADDAHGRQVTRVARLLEDRLELVDEALRQRMARTRATHDDVRRLTSSTASRTVMTAVSTRYIDDWRQARDAADDRSLHGMYAPALGLSVWPVYSDAASREQEDDRVGHLFGRPKRPKRHVAQPVPAGLAVDQIRGHVRSRSRTERPR